MLETKTVYRWWWIWDFEKEEAWFNQMALEGWALEKVGFCRYTFVRCQPGAYTIRLEMHQLDDAYLDFMAGTGAQYLGRVFQWVYFRKPAELGAFDLFSDLDSRLTHLERMSKMLLAIGLANIGLGVANSLHVTRLGLVNLLCGCLLMYALGRIHGKMEELEKERQLHE